MLHPFIVDPSTYSKERALEDAVLYVEAFLDLNDIPHVQRYLFSPDDGQKPPGRNVWHDKGWYWNETLFVNLKRSRPPVKTPGFAWSYTGFKADLTAPGVLAHETGHHIHFRPRMRGPELIPSLKMIAGIAAKEAPVSGYEPNPYEVFAEAARLFILNPELLREGRPQRFRMLTDEFGLKPPHDAPWREVLKHAHPKIIAAAESWIKRGDLPI